MLVRNVAKARRRGFGGFVVCLASLALLAAGPATARAALSTAMVSSKSVIRLSLAEVPSGREALEIRGVSGSEAGEFSAVANVSRILCPGSYRYSVQSEIQDSGVLSSYAARVTLAPLAPAQGGSCKSTALPFRRGALDVSLRGAEETIDFSQKGPSGPGDFFGDFTYSTQPVCDQRYTLAVGADLRGWDRHVRYRFQVVHWESEALGSRLESEAC